MVLSRIFCSLSAMSLLYLDEAILMSFQHKQMPFTSAAARRRLFFVAELSSCAVPLFAKKKHHIIWKVIHYNIQQT